MKMKRTMNSNLPDDQATQYCLDVLNEKIIACKKIKLACKRHLNDLEKSKNDDFPYEYKPEEGQKVIDFVSKLVNPHTEDGKLTPVNFQMLIIHMIYSWRFKETGFRRFRRAYISMARKNGKSLLISALALYDYLYAERPSLGKQITISANSLDQAMTPFNLIKQQIKDIQRRSKKFRKSIKVNENKIINIDNDATMKALHSGSNKLDGLNVRLALIDEYHEAINSKMLEVLKSSQTLQEEPLVCIVTTAGFNLSSVCYTDEYKYSSSILDGKATDESYLALIWENENVEELKDSSTWIKSNPLMAEEGQSENMKRNLEAELNMAIQKNTLNGVLVKNYNMWTQSSEDSYLSVKDWEKCIGETPDIKGRRAYIGVDLSRTNDLTSVSWVIPIDEENKFYVDSFSFVATKDVAIEVKSKKESIDYTAMEKEGYCSITKKQSGIIDEEAVFNFIVSFIEDNNLKVEGIYFDPYSANGIITRLEDYYQIVIVKQNSATLNKPTRKFKTDVYEESIIHRNNPLLNLAVNNAIEKENNDLLMIDKEQNRRKIDPLAALLNGFSGVVDYDFNPVDLNEFYKSDDFGF